jgi:hypothetical protein
MRAGLTPAMRLGPLPEALGALLLVLITVAGGRRSDGSA